MVGVCHKLGDKISPLLIDVRLPIFHNENFITRQSDICRRDLHMLFCTV